LGHS